MKIFSFLKYYKTLEKHIIQFIVAEFFLQLINAAFMAIMLIYMEKVGYKDYESASFVSFRFLGVLLFAFPLGLIIKGRKLKPIFYASSVLTPILSLIILEAIDIKIDWLLGISLFLWGISFTGIQVSALPYILRNAKKEIYFATFAFTDKAIATELVLAMQRNVTVKGICEKRMKSEIKDLLEYQGAEVYYDTNPKTMHHKLFVIDNTTWTGSYNPTKNGNLRNDENVIVINNYTIAKKFILEFYHLTNHAKTKIS